MSFYDTLKKRLPSDLFDQVVGQLGDDFDYDLVPRTRLNKVIGQREEAKQALEELQNSKSQEQVDVEALRAQWKQEHEADIGNVHKQYRALDALRSSNCIDPELVWSAGLLKLDQINIDEHGQVTGLQEQIEELKRGRSALFTTPKAEPEVPGGTGKEGGEDAYEGASMTREKFLQLSYDKQLDFKSSHPEQFRSFFN